MVGGLGFTVHDTALCQSVSTEMDLELDIRREPVILTFSLVQTGTCLRGVIVVRGGAGKERKINDQH